MADNRNRFPRRNRFPPPEPLDPDLQKLADDLSKLDFKWSNPAAACSELATLGVTELGEGPTHNHTDGRCDLVFIDAKGSTFHLIGNYYDRRCFDPVIKWAQEGKV